MPIIRILHASDLHFALTPRLVSFVDRFSAGISLKRAWKTVFSGGGTRAVRTWVKRTATYSTHDPSMTLALADFLYQDYSDNHLVAGGTPISAVVLTGDLATTGSIDNLERARDFLSDPPNTPPGAPPSPAESLIKPGSGTLAYVLEHRDCKHPRCADQLRLCLLPGNHDRLELAHVDHDPGGTNFDSVFANYWDAPILSAASPLPNAAPDVAFGPYVKTWGLTSGSLHVEIIAADFNLLDKDHRKGSRLNKYAQGRVYRRAAPRHPDILSDLVTATESAQLAHPDAFVLWATHFPPRFPHISRQMKLIDDAELVREANRLGVAAVLSGHTHEPVQYRSPGMDFDVLCAGTATQHHSTLDHHLQIIEVSDDGAGVAVQINHYRFDDSLSAFIPV